jgi:hypothetical protein
MSEAIGRKNFSGSAATSEARASFGYPNPIERSSGEMERNYLHRSSALDDNCCLSAGRPTKPAYVYR